MRSWKHSGFSVDQSVRLEPDDQEGVQRLIQYCLRCPFSQARQGWAALIRQVYEANPLRCARCGAELKIIAFIEQHQTEVIRLR